MTTPLRPNLHFLIPLSDGSTQLEARLYLPIDAPSSSACHSALPLTSTLRSQPIPAKHLDATVIRILREWGIERLITAAHPWAKLNGNMLFPVIAFHLVDAAMEQEKRTAVLSFNVRGVGRSTGSQPWHGLSMANDAKDFAEMEAWAVRALGVREVLRVGYSWGTMGVLDAPPPRDHGITSILLISPPLTIFWAMSFITRSFQRSVHSILSPPGASRTDSTKTHVWMIYGDRDDFTGVTTYQSLAEALRNSDLVMREIDGAGHFYASENEGERLEAAIVEWLGSTYSRQGDDEYL